MIVRTEHPRLRRLHAPLWPAAQVALSIALIAATGATCLASEETDAAAAKSEYLRREYAADAERYEFFADSDGAKRLTRSEKPVMRWANDNDWSGDVYVWTLDGLPQVLGCILSGARSDSRYVYHEFHILAEKPLPPVALHTRRRWEPQEGVRREPVPGAPRPAATASRRLAQMREMCRQFTAHMHAEGSDWEMRLLPQPLYRYGDENSSVVDGALFTYVWTRGTDAELILMFECRQEADGRLAWYWAPVRFSNKPLWLTHAGKQVWRVPGHSDPNGSVTKLPYTTAFARTMPATPPIPSAETPPSTPATDK